MDIWPAIMSSLQASCLNPVSMVAAQAHALVSPNASVQQAIFVLLCMSHLRAGPHVSPGHCLEHSSADLP